jgi:hypothetical protein
MNTSPTFLLAILSISIGLTAQNQAPQVEITQVDLDQQTSTMSIFYTLSDVENDPCTVYLAVSSDGGTSFTFNASSASGDIGFGIMSGSNKRIDWNYAAISNLADMRVRVIADDEQVPSVEEMVQRLDSVRLRNTLKHLEGVRHFSSNPAGLQNARDSIFSRIQLAGLFSETQPFNYQSGNTTVQAVNIHAAQAGMVQEAITYVLDAHYDGVPNSPAADDNASGMAAVLEIMGILKDYHFKKSIRYIAFDLEESGLIGSNRYVQSGIKPYEQIDGVINLEMIAYYSNEPNSQLIPAGFDMLFPQATQQIEAEERRGNFISVVGNQASNALVQDFNTAAANFVPELRTISLVVPGNGQIAPDLRRSDHASFWDAGMKALMITDGANFRNQNYHTPNDTSGSLNYTFMLRVAQAALATLVTLAEPMHAGYAEYDFSFLSARDHIHHFPFDIKVFPNPAGKELFLEWTNQSGRAYWIEWKIFDQEGKQHNAGSVHGTQGNQQFKLDLHKLQAANYILLLQCGEATKYLKFVKEN